jgi:hypothetical protein
MAGVLGAEKAKAQNMIAVNTTNTGGQTVPQLPDYSKHRNAVRWLVEESALATPDTSDNVQSTQE